MTLSQCLLIDARKDINFFPNVFPRVWLHEISAHQINKFMCGTYHSPGESSPLKIDTKAFLILAGTLSCSQLKTKKKL